MNDKQINRIINRSRELTLSAYRKCIFDLRQVLDFS